MSTEGSLTTLGGNGHDHTEATSPLRHEEAVETLFSIKLHRRKYFQGMAYSLADIPPEHCARFGGSHRHLFVEIDQILMEWSPGWIGQALYFNTISSAVMTALSRYSRLFSSFSSAIAYLAVVCVLSLGMLVLLFLLFRSLKQSKLKMESHLDACSRETGMQFDILWKDPLAKNKGCCSPPEPGRRGIIGCIIVRSKVNTASMMNAMRDPRSSLV